jgi:hypothetical protein
MKSYYILLVILIIVLYFIYRDKEEAFDFSIDKTKNTSPSIQPSFNAKWNHTCELFDKCVNGVPSPSNAALSTLTFDEINQCINNNVEPCLNNKLNNNPNNIPGYIGSPSTSTFQSYCLNRGDYLCSMNPKGLSDHNNSFCKGYIDQKCKTDNEFFKIYSTVYCRNELLSKCSNKDYILSNAELCKSVGMDPCIYSEYNGVCDCTTEVTNIDCTPDSTPDSTGKYYKTTTTKLLYPEQKGGKVCFDIQGLFNRNNVPFVRGNSVIEKTECPAVNCITSEWRDSSSQCYSKNGSFVKDQIRDVRTPSKYGGECITTQSIPCNAVNCTTSDWVDTDTTVCPKIQTKTVTSPALYGGSCDISTNKIGDSITRTVDCTEAEKCNSSSFLSNYCLTTTDTTLSFYDTCKTKYNITNITCDNKLQTIKMQTDLYNLFTYGATGEQVTYTPEWSTWSDCNNGVQTRSIISCKDNKGYSVDISKCGGPKTETQGCSWRVDSATSWSVCSNNLQRRTINGCIDTAGNRTYDTTKCGGPIQRQGCISSTSSSTSSNDYNPFSDYTLKQNIDYNFKYGLKDLLELKPVKFDYIDNELGKEQLGFIAQDLKEIIPEAVSTSTYKDEEKYRINPSFIIPVLVNSVKELKSELDSLKSKLK